MTSNTGKIFKGLAKRHHLSLITDAPSHELSPDKNSLLVNRFARDLFTVHGLIYNREFRVISRQMDLPQPATRPVSQQLYIISCPLPTESKAWLLSTGLKDEPIFGYFRHFFRSEPQQLDGHLLFSLEAETNQRWLPIIGLLPAAANLELSGQNLNFFVVDSPKDANIMEHQLRLVDQIAARLG
ncbi:MAG TPA: hypothetical protein VGA08_00445 [Candidatus Saccharimonadales bacterium]